MSKIIFTEEGSKPPAPSSGQVSLYVKTDEVVYIQDSLGNETSLGTASGITGLIGDVTASGPGVDSATVNYVGGQSAANVASATVLSNSATNTNTVNAIVKRDSSGNFSAGIITASLNGNASTATTSTSFSGSLSGDVTGTQSSTVVSTVGGSSASNIHSAELLANAATSLNTGNDIVKRDNTGSFSATNITANLIGNVSGSSSSFTGSLFGDVTGTQSSTSIASTTVTGKVLTGYSSGPNSAVLSTDSILTAFGKVQGQITSISGSSVTSVTATSPIFSTGGQTPNITIQQSTTSQNGYLSSTDWNTFNNKQPSGNYITALTGDAIASGPGSSALTLATVNSNVGSFGSSTAIPSITVNAKGLITATSTNAVVAPAGTLTGTTLASNVISSSLTSVANNAITNAMLAQAPANTLKGNNTGVTANEQDLTGTQVTAMLTPFIGDSGSGGTQGLVPSPSSGTAAAGDFLSANGSFAYVDQSTPLYNPFSFIGITPWTGSTTTKFENIATYTGIDGHKQYAAIVAGGTAGTLFIWDITDPFIPILCSHITLAGAYNVSVAQISGSIYAFVPSSGGSTLYIINVTNPFSLSTTSSLLISGSPGALYTCVYSNGYVYIATQSKGLTVVDVGGGLAGGTLTTPVQSFQEGGTTNKTAGVAIFGNYVFTTNYQTTFPATVRYLKTWELAAGGGTLAVPYLANTYTISGGPTGTSTKPSGIAINSTGTTAYITDGNQNVIDIINITSPTSPSYITYLTPSYTLVDNTLETVVTTATLVGNYVYVPSGSNATNGGCIDLFDVTNLSSPIKINSMYTGVPNDVFGGIALNNGYIFGADYGVSGNYSGIAVFTQAYLNPSFGATVTSNLQVQQLTPNTAIVSNGSQQLISSSTTATELGYVHGVTSNIQSQINTLVASSGIQRIVTSISTSTTLGSSPLKDYVYLVSGTTTVTLPTAIGNSNLYTIKNVDSGTITITTTSSQTIDGSLTISLTTKYTSLDIISDGSNWNII